MSENNYKSTLNEAALAFRSISIYRNLMEDSVIKSFKALVNRICSSHPSLADIMESYTGAYYELANKIPFYSLKEYIIEKLLLDENPYSRTAEKESFLTLDKNLLQAVSQDFYLLQRIANLSSSDIKAYLLNTFCHSDFEKHAVKNLPSWDFVQDSSFISKEKEHLNPLKTLFYESSQWSGYIQDLSDFLYQYGCGLFSIYNAFLWEGSGEEGKFLPVAQPDSIRLSDMIGYDTQRAEVIINTLHFLEGLPTNNILLYGDRGTGKSSTVKALLNEYHSKGLRIVEVSKDQLVDFQKISRRLRGLKQKFIIFVDDLAFEDSEENYTALKAVLEGGLECKASNVVIYATSNRRHLIKEKFSDRVGLQSGNMEDEVRSGDTIQEKLSLSDRFGITVMFPSPDKYKYLEIAEGIALNRGLKFDREFLHREALKWELWYNGRSPRTARQFIDWLEANQ